MKVGFIGLGIIGCPIDAERGRAGLPASGRGRPTLRARLDGAAEGGGEPRAVECAGSARHVPQIVNRLERLGVTAVKMSLAEISDTVGRNQAAAGRRCTLNAVPPRSAGSAVVRPYPNP